MGMGGASAHVPADYRGVRRDIRGDRPLLFPRIGICEFVAADRASAMDALLFCLETNSSCIFDKDMGSTTVTK